MIELSAARIAALTEGRLTRTVAGDLTIDVAKIGTDSRETGAGSVYVAKVGEHADGHDYIPAAIASGAVLVLAERELNAADGAPYPAVIVPDAVAAMGLLAAEVVRVIRAAGELTVVGITGSAGKTTTKDLLAGVFARVAETVAPQESFNGEIGVPLTVFRADLSTRFLVVEMGATKIGHIQYLAQMVKPDIGVVLGVGSAHSGEFGGVANIAQAKGEMVEALGRSGTAVLNLGDSRVSAMAARTVAPVLWFGEAGLPVPDGQPALLAENVRSSARATPEFDLRFPDGSAWPIRSELIGGHHLNNLLAAGAAAWAAGLPAEQIAAGLSGQGAKSRWRMERTERADGVTVINDAYNANPESMRAALRALAELGRGDGDPANRRRTWAVLGAMLNLGEESIQAHSSLGQTVVRLNISRLLVIGAQARPLHIGAINEGSWGEESVHVPDLDSAFDFLQEELRPGDIVLFKSSRDSGLRYLGDRIALAQAQDAEQHPVTSPEDSISTVSDETSGED
ncbi:UDP-N-acetylmuramoyl-tripeptide--D-alanyl-D-alanine ligase [Arthrobacter russicus]|uniref:UDP-N-acetylmuramoyl-tripeptide--D-alanyl-D-alanine ligase n=1 Tax=Arthrobacter russicus TaxID=172040 RepID=A0ABU1JF56_9MICC|nr:UDP-N-acetylmuramoyl-tripeptide--D-alanyl-D-alanine ligase [Arthrobacter russicus]MDR6271091.1 UDP-N-acetylmuramoyl-tripeptide--D-alanyl-D-alanine ligase [Arthrobacter russicus]